jgi:hypothetical protein
MASVDARLVKATKFPPEFNQKVDMQKVNLAVMKKFVPPPQQARASATSRTTTTTTTRG